MNELWNYISKNELKLDLTNIPQNLKCSLCNEILKEAVISTCGCSFCKQCINQHIERNSKLCPSCLNKNKFNEISLENGLKSDRESDSKIHELTLICPNLGCEDNFELRYLLDHLKCCKLLRVSCTFHKIGCEIPNMNTEGGENSREILMSNAITLENEMNSFKLVEGVIKNLKNDINRLTNENGGLQVEIKQRAVEIRNIEEGRLGDRAEIVTMKEELAELKSAREEDTLRIFLIDEKITQIMNDRDNDRMSMNKTEEEVIKLEREIFYLKDDKKRDNIYKEKMGKERLVLKNEIDKIKKEGQKEKGNNNEVTIPKKDMGKIKVEREESSWRITMAVMESDRKRNYSRSQNSEEIAELKRGVQKKSAKTEDGAGAASSSSSVSQRCHQCTLSDLSGMVLDEWRFSDTFPICGYSMSVGICKFYGILAIYVWLDPLLADEEVQWPMKLKMKVTVMNQNTGKMIGSRHFCHAKMKNTIDYNKPTDEKVCIRDSEFPLVPKINEVTVIVEAIY